MNMDLITIKTEPGASENLHQVCRLCLSEESLDDVFQEEDLHQWISDFLSLTISPEDRMSKVICAICRIRLIEFQQFRLHVQEVQDVLQSQFQNEIEEAEKGLSVQVKECKKRKTMHGSKANGCKRCGKRAGKRKHLNRHMESHTKVVNDDDKTKPSVRQATSDELQQKAEAKQYEGIDSSTETQEERVEPKATAEAEHCHEYPDDDNYELQDSDSSDESYGSEQDHERKGDKRKHHGKVDDDQTIGMEDMIEIEDMKMEYHTDAEVISPVDEAEPAMHDGLKKQEKKAGKPIQCNVCSKKYKTTLLLWHHNRAAHGPKNHECLVCRVSFALRSTLKQHERTMKHANNLRNHQEAKENLELPVEKVQQDTAQVNTEEDTAQERGANLKQNTSIESNDGEYSCPKCDRSFNRQCQLKNHMRVHEDPVKQGQTFYAEESDYLSGEEDSDCSSKTDQPTQANEESNDNRKQWRCDKCPKSYSQERNLKEHMRYHRPRKYICPICGRPFLKRYGLRNHIPTHDSPRPKPASDAKEKTDARPYKCDICQKAFKSQSAQWGHKKHVHGPKIFGCHICSFKFSVRKDLARHVRRHYSSGTYPNGD